MIAGYMHATLVHWQFSLKQTQTAGSCYAQLTDILRDIVSSTKVDYVRVIHWQGICCTTVTLSLRVVKDKLHVSYGHKLAIASCVSIYLKTYNSDLL